MVLFAKKVDQILTRSALRFLLRRMRGRESLAPTGMRSLPRNDGVRPASKFLALAAVARKALATGLTADEVVAGMLATRVMTGEAVVKEAIRIRREQENRPATGTIEPVASLLFAAWMEHSGDPRNPPLPSDRVMVLQALSTMLRWPSMTFAEVGARFGGYTRAHGRKLPTLEQLKEVPLGSWPLKPGDTDPVRVFRKYANRPEAGRMSAPVALPPQSIEAEEALLSAVLLRPDIVSDLKAFVVPGDLCAPKHQWALEAVYVLHERGAPIDPTSVANEPGPDGKMSNLDLRQLWNSPTSTSSWRHYADTIVDMSRRRRLIYTLSQTTQSVYDMTKTVDEVLADYDPVNADHLIANRGGDVAGLASMQDFIATAKMPINQRERSIPGMVRRMWRCILVGEEGAGKFSVSPPARTPRCRGS